VRSGPFQSTPRTGKYRPEIDGLRAIAVLSVLFFHANVVAFSGGFVGVDIFYVISGFLITSIIAQDVALGRFSFISFYERRMRRIFPALFAVVLFCTLAAAVLFVPQDLAVFGRSLIAMTLFVSNIFFKNEGGAAGYFGNTSDSQVLLHTWSLSVEEQFYLLFPTALILLASLARRRQTICLWLVVIMSFLVNVWTTQYRPRTAFYILIPRAWELLIGSLLALKAVPPLERRISREIVGLVGLGLIGWAIFVLTKETAFPGFSALFPCLGAWLIIYAGETGPSSVRTVLSLPPLVFIGVMSYSLYLWHWPMFVFSRYFIVSANTSSGGKVIAVMISSLVMAFISFKFIESPFRGTKSRVTRRQIFACGLAASGLSVGAGLMMYSFNGFPSRYPAATRHLILTNTDRKSDYLEVCSNYRQAVYGVADIAFCNLGLNSLKKIMFLGDSHIQQLFPLIRTIYDKGGLRNRGVVFAVSTGCPLTEHMNLDGFHCDSFAHFAMMRAKESDIDTVFIGFAAWWSLSDKLCPSVDGRCVGRIGGPEIRRRVLDELSVHIHELKILGKQVIVSLPFPLYDRSIPDLLIRNEVFPGFRAPEVATERTPPSVRAQIALVAESMGAAIFDPRISLCPAGKCITQVDGMSIYKDDSHIAASQIGILEGDMQQVLR
jgi:peptidoglycan/LPS O-acetylase OafA/YrhL